MIEVYLWINAAIYILFALWCTFQKTQTSKASGYLTLNNSGWSEYLVIYGGLQFGLAGFFGYLASQAELHQIGIIFSLILYVPIVLYRLTTVYKFRPVKRITLAIATMEIILLLAAVILNYKII
ncbi:MAG: DUF4345 domain-containing protein [Pseudomonadota bacterium]